MAVEVELISSRVGHSAGRQWLRDIGLNDTAADASRQQVRVVDGGSSGGWVVGGVFCISRIRKWNRIV